VKLGAELGHNHTDVSYENHVQVSSNKHEDDAKIWDYVRQISHIAYRMCA